ncbi:MAG: hypothetical protein CME65_12660 [Halobacteriovoraceae bacterium]|nr:hypothetical protein [Halobacteriovoraceae bacterium]|tara:strand:- start:14466 stop:15245 length:780 start_codon:yes stop_codon:yes gene_type:complete
MSDEDKHDGISVFNKQANKQNINIIPLIESCAQWVDPRTFAYLPIWYPEYHRRCVQMNAEYSAAYQINGADKREANERGKTTLSKALYGKSKGEKNWTCCHIWGIDDESFVKPNSIVQDARFYTNVANMVNLPTPLKAFTDCMQDIKNLLRLCSYFTYGFKCEVPKENISQLDIFNSPLPDNYPKSWPRSLEESGSHITHSFNAAIKKQADERFKQMKKDYLLHQNNHLYPKDRVKQALDYAYKFCSDESPLKLDPFWR